MPVFVGALLALGLFLLIVLARALLFVPEKEPKADTAEAVSVEIDRAMESLQQMIQVPTVSCYDPSQEDPSAFKNFRALLKERFPTLHRDCPPAPYGTGGLLYRIPGRSAQSPTVLMAHYDVVPADAVRWHKPPFGGEIENGELWGRGTLDTKGTLCAALSAAEALLGNGFTPERDIYLAFSSGEEVSGPDAPAIVDELERRKIRAGLVVDEGGAVVEGIFPGVRPPCALVGIAEKGLLNVTLTAKSGGGHASAPPPPYPALRGGRGLARGPGGRLEDASSQELAG
jgi:carboxypeptidase PM20D1